MKAIAAVAALGATVLLVAGCSSGAASDPAAISTSPAPASPAPASPTPTPSVPAPNAPAGTPAPDPVASAAAPRGYISQADYEKDPAAYAASNVVLFFRADWCSECRETDANLKAAKGDFPKKLIVVNIDYDDNRDLKKKYGVTVQHTFVHVAPDGSLIKKWSGSFTPQDINAEV